MDESSTFQQDLFWDFNALIDVRHDVIPMAWVSEALDLNEAGETLYFIPGDHSIQALDVNPNRNNSTPITRELYASICDDVKAMCKGRIHFLGFSCS